MNISLDKNQTILFVSLSLVYCFLSFVAEPIPFDWAIKILPIILLLSTCLLAYRQQPNNKLRLFILGLTFCMAGDVFLAVDRERLFVFGLGSFLIGHLFYITALVPVIKKNLLSLSALILYGVAMMSTLIPNLNELLIPVVIYMLVLLVMAATCITSTRSNLMLILGGVSFTISDSLIGLDKFYTQIPYAGVWIMITYYLAQYCLTKGFLTSSNKAN